MAAEDGSKPDHDEARALLDICARVGARARCGAALRQHRSRSILHNIRSATLPFLLIYADPLLRAHKM
jgi:hypothetical protein